MSALPILDLAQLDRGGPAAEAFRTDLREATHDVGFCYLTGHGIPDDVVAGAFAAAERFFALPDEAKRSVEMLRSPHFRGYTRTGGELTRGQVDWREQIDLGAERSTWDDPDAPAYMRLEGPNLWPEAQPELREVFTDWERRCTVVAQRLMAAWALSLGGPADRFDGLFGDRPSTLIKLIRYPGREERGQGVGAHQDPGVLTLLMIEPGKGGLQVERDGAWVDAPAVPGAFVVNIGELLEFATDGYLKATVHRVESPPPGETRLSIPFFFNPALDSTVPRVELPPELAARARGVTADPDNVISGTFGDNLLKARLRAHPDVAAAHHPDLVAALAR
ncbi:isopenicillin N synthase family dioxygenase [Actinomycetospora soli]|uniref:isopenicillin N synthase family dioxygenase n=1 Tax=Actinomycetospora soli TaxID=2893887 RepID=UPI001E51F02B|nr:2-oxoglutarate and iron-dependent oxygenase domain-containing protein [Actinomycetospora soli]MCD2188022.1 isopenicillin N synthase family oxygenase [Actinomycetospora soli]